MAMFNQNTIYNPAAPGGDGMPPITDLFAGPGSNQYQGSPGIATVPGNSSSSGFVSAGSYGYNPGTGVGGPTAGPSSGAPQPAAPTGPYPGAVPPASTGAPGSLPIATVNQLNNPTAKSPFPTGSSIGIGGGNETVPTFDPNFTGQLYSWLQQQLGQGVTPYNLSTPLPGGGSTQAGQLAAPLNSVDKSLESFYSGGPSTTPGSRNLQTLAENGPNMAGQGQDTLTGIAKGVNTTQAWQDMLTAMNGPLGANSQQAAQMRGQFAGSGALGSSEFGNSVASFEAQTAANENALLSQSVLQGLGLSESAGATLQSDKLQAAGIQEGAASTLMGGAASFGANLQNLDQNAIQQQLAEFIRTQPQYSPLLQMLYGAGTSSPGAIGKNAGVGGTGAAIAGSGSALQGIADIWTSIKDSQNTAPSN